MGEAGQVHPKELKRMVVMDRSWAISWHQLVVALHQQISGSTQWCTLWQPPRLRNSEAAENASAGSV